MQTQDAVFTSSQIAEACGGNVVSGDPHAAASGVCTDSRQILPGQAFFALRGERFDAHDFLPQAVAAGASILVVDRPPAASSVADETAVVGVEDTTDALLALASWHRRRLGARVIGVTGSYGKSTVKNMLGAVLSAGHRCTTAPASYNNRIGVALTLLSAGTADDFVVLEMGTNHPGEIDELARAARPDIGVITAVAEVHLEGLGDLDGVREAKAELIPHVNAEGLLVLSADPICASLADRFAGRVRTFGMEAGADLRPGHVHRDGDGWAFRALGSEFRLPVGGRYNVANAAAALCVAEHLGVPPEVAGQALAHSRPPKMRYERKSLGGVRFVLDCYNSNPSAARAAARSFLGEFTPGRRVIVCGDMLELGERAEDMHRRLGRDLGASEADLLVAVGPLGRHVAEGWRRESTPDRPALWFESASDAWWPLWRVLEPGDAVLLKGSRGMELERITRKIEEHLKTAEKETAA